LNVGNISNKIVKFEQTNAVLVEYINNEWYSNVSDAPTVFSTLFDLQTNAVLVEYINNE